MNKLIGPIAFLALFLSTASAQADEVKGKVAAINTTTGVLLLDDGKTFTIAEGVNMEGLEPGTEVTVSYEEQVNNNQRVATEVAPSN